MSLDTELADLGEPPVSAVERCLMEVLDQFLAIRDSGKRVHTTDLLPAATDLRSDGTTLLRVAESLEEFVSSVWEQSGLENIPLPPTEIIATLPDPFPEVYRIRQSLGEGKFGHVWLADHLSLDIPVALKTLHFHVTGKDREVALILLRNEARILARLEHPNIVRVYDLAQSGDAHYLVLQYVEGGSLEARLEREGPLGWQRAARYIADVGEALQHVHACGVIHRDIKPANILWNRQRDEALLTDFGVATRLADSGLIAGTPLYMAPEAFIGNCTPAGDVYGLAASLFTLVTGRVPFQAETRSELLRRIHEGLADVEPLFAGVPDSLERLIRAGLAAIPEQRPSLSAFVAELRGALNRLLADSLILPAAPVELRLSVSRWEGGKHYVPVAGTQPTQRGVPRDMTKVPPQPERIGLRTGDRVRIEVLANREGYLTVFNVGPTGQLNLLYPEPASKPVMVPANQLLHVLDVAMTPPAGAERLFAVWSQTPLSLEKAAELTRGDKGIVSPSYWATRNMERVRESVQQLRREDWHAVVLELDHGS